MKKLLLSVVVICLIISSCNNSESTSADKKDVKAATEAKKDIPKGRYALKSAIVEMKTEVMGFAQKHVLMFDNYGSTERTDITGNILGQKSHNININKDGYVYSIDMIRKTGSKMKIPTKSGEIDFENLGAEIAKEMNIKKVGTETFLGKSCDKYTIDDKKLKMKGSYLVWKGISLKTDMTVMGMKSVIVATKIDENPTITNDKFEVPAGIKMQN